MTRFSVIPAAHVYLIRGNAVLLQLRRNTGYMDGLWTAGAAGHVEPGDAAAVAAVRELREELALEVPPGALRASSVMQRTDGTSDPAEQGVDWFFSGSSWNGESTIRKPHK